jgi:hypothetical protein
MKMNNDKFSELPLFSLSLGKNINWVPFREKELNNVYASDIGICPHLRKKIYVIAIYDSSENEWKMGWSPLQSAAFVFANRAIRMRTEQDNFPFAHAASPNAAEAFEVMIQKKNDHYEKSSLGYLFKQWFNNLFK